MGGHGVTPVAASPNSGRRAAAPIDLWTDSEKSTETSASGAGLLENADIFIVSRRSSSLQWRRLAAVARVASAEYLHIFIHRLGGRKRACALTNDKKDRK